MTAFSNILNNRKALQTILKYYIIGMYTGYFFIKKYHLCIL